MPPLAAPLDDDDDAGVDPDDDDVDELLDDPQAATTTARPRTSAEMTIRHPARPLLLRIRLPS
ncbi:MAG TPA: hypothetical protein VFL87_06370 [Thermoleophilaceae bacterium]|nr:hypothetical protein [Thermoleophilaceae bacterium]